MEFVSPDPKALVRAANVRATLDAFQLRPSLGQRLIQKHELQLEDLRPEKFILVQRWLDTLKEILETVGPNVLHRVGVSMIENAALPPEINSLDVLLSSMDAIYYMNHQGDVGHYRTEGRGNGVWEIRCETPYPRQFEHGMVEGCCRNQQVTGGKAYHVQYIDGPAAADLTCTLIVRPV